MLVDSHCHLNFDSFADDLDGVVARAEQAGVGMMVSIGTRLDEVKDVSAIANTYNQVVYSIGVHPNEVADYADLQAEQLVEIAAAPKVVGLGESGLDFYRDDKRAILQEKLFRLHIDAARQTGLPVIIHSRAADQDMARILSEEMELGAFTAVMHCFTASRQLAQTALDLGLYISISGIITFKNAQDLREIVCDIPARPAAGRNRCALSSARASSRRAQRAGLCRRNRQSGRAAQKHLRAGAGSSNQR